MDEKSDLIADLEAEIEHLNRQLREAEGIRVAERRSMHHDYLRLTVRRDDLLMKLCQLASENALLKGRIEVLETANKLSALIAEKDGDRDWETVKRR